MISRILRNALRALYLGIPPSEKNRWQTPGYHAQFTSWDEKSRIEIMGKKWQHLIVMSYAYRRVKALLLIFN